jgi:preprotein translocase subunit SecG
MLLNILLALHILICIALIGVILLQRSEGGAFGVGGGGNSFMTARGAGDLLTRTTAILAGLFFLLSLILTLLSGRGTGSVTENLDINAMGKAPPAANAPLQAPAPTNDSLLPTAPAPAAPPLSGLSAPAPEPAQPANR